MKYLYRVKTGLSSGGTMCYNVQFRPWWFPFWLTLTYYWSDSQAFERIDEEVRKNNFKGKVITRN